MFHTLGKPAAVYLDYSRTRDIIAIEPASPRLSESFPVIANRCNRHINATPFCRHFGIDIDTTLKIPPTRNCRKCPPSKTNRNRLRRRPEEEEQVAAVVLFQMPRQVTERKYDTLPKGLTEIGKIFIT